jgi:hypothetical protein
MQVEEGSVPAYCTGCSKTQAEMLMPPLVLLVVEGDEVPLVLEDGPSKFKTICSFVFEGKLKVTCCALEPWPPMLSEICSPPPAGLLILMAICSGLEPLLPELKFKTISGPDTGLGFIGGSNCLCPLCNSDCKVVKACCAPAKSPDCSACPMVVKACSRWVLMNGFPLGLGPY